MMKSLVHKRKSLGGNVLKPRARKRKSPGAVYPIVRSLLLNRILMSPRTGLPGARRAMSPSTSNGVSPRTRSPSARSPSLHGRRTITSRDLAQGKERASTSGMSDAWSSMVRDILAKVDYLCEKMYDLTEQVNDNNYKLTKLSKKVKKDK
ncbi:hypothetical protein ACP4OV_012341 [Aristida adscensionis]